MSKTKAILVHIPAEDHTVLSSMSKAIGRTLTAQVRYMLSAVAANKDSQMPPPKSNLIGSREWMDSEERKAWDQFMAASMSNGLGCVASAHLADQALKIRKNTHK